MRLRIDVSGAAPAVLIEEPEDCTALSISAPEDRRIAAAWALRGAGWARVLAVDVAPGSPLLYFCSDFGALASIAG
jgi:hypothetical protein